MMKLNELVTEYRQEYNISQREFARRCDLSHGIIHLIERGTNPQTGKEMSQDLDTLKKITSGMGITLQELFERIGDSDSVYVPMSEDQKILVAYHKANVAIQEAVNKLLDIK